LPPILSHCQLNIYLKGTIALRANQTTTAFTTATQALQWARVFLQSRRKYFALKSIGLLAELQVLTASSS
jgi:hypothetical protein